MYPIPYTNLKKMDICIVIEKIEKVQILNVTRLVDRKQLKISDTGKDWADILYLGEEITKRTWNEGIKNDNTSTITLNLTTLKMIL